MADGLCEWDADGPHARNHIITRLSPPATVELCDEHYGPGLIPLLADELGVDPGPFYAHVEKYIKREAAKADRALAEAQAGAAAEGSEGPARTDDDMAAEAAATDRQEAEETGLFHGYGEEAL